jgi:SAM-dependent methyltransferase
MNYLDKVKNVFDQWAISGRADKIEVGHTFSANEMLKLLEYRDEFCFLDIGCGNGWTVRKIASLPNCKNACGIDASYEMIQLAKNRKINEKENYICSDFCNCENNEKFDVVFSMEALYYFKPIENTLLKIYSSLKNNGMLIMGIDYYKENIASQNWPEMLGLEMFRESIEAWKTLLKTAGFNDIHSIQIKEANSVEEWKRIAGTLAIYAKK